MGYIVDPRTESNPNPNPNPEPKPEPNPKWGFTISHKIAPKFAQSAV